MKDVIFVTGNQNKVNILRRLLGHEIAHKPLDLDELQSVDPVFVAEHKARQAYSILKKPVLIEDTSVIFHALGKLPGPLIKWFLDEAGLQGCCDLLNGFNDRSAEARVTYVYYDGKDMHVFDGKLDGTIAKEPLGEGGFGWDKIFIPAGHSNTFGQMEEAVYYDNSVRNAIVKKLKLFLK